MAVTNRLATSVRLFGWLLLAVVPFSDATYCSNNGAVRLAGGSDSYEGRVEICHSNEWGTVCDDFWDDDDARVVCRQLGYSTTSATPYSNAHFGQGNGQIWLDDVSCHGYESTLGSCSKSSYGSTDCSHYEDAGVRCGSTTPSTSSSYCYYSGAVRLVGGYNSYEGRVEFCKNNEWGTVCDNDWDTDDARVVCRQLGLPTSGAAAHSDAYYGEGSGRIWLDDVTCDGSESRLDECPVYTYSPSCYHYEDAGVRCVSDNTYYYTTLSPYCNSGEIRLVGGGTPSRGRVEIFHNSRWGTVCDDSWDSSDARVVCRQLGFSTTGVTAYSNAHFGEGSGEIWLNEVNCHGHEYSLANCSKNNYGANDCSHSEDAGVYCGEGNDYCTNNAVRLVGGSTNTEGRVEICKNNQWGTVCDDDWDTDDARVVCRQLGFSTDDARAYSNAHYGQGYGEIVLSDMECYGGESSLSSCYSGSYYIDCVHSEDAGVSCGSSESCVDGEDCGTFYGLVIGGSVGGVLLFICLPIIIISIVSHITRRKRRRQAVRVSTAGGGGRSTGQATYRPLQQYPPPTVTTVGSTSNTQTGVGSTETYTTPVPLYQFHQSGDSFIATEHAQFEVPNEDPPPYSESDPLLLRDQQAQLENEQDVEAVSDSFYPQGEPEDIQTEGEVTIVIRDTADNFNGLQFNTSPTTSTACSYSDTNVEEQKAPV